VALADEPTGNLDQETGRRTLDLLESLNREDGTTIVVITHDPMVASRMPRRIDLLDGRVVRDSVTSVPDPVPMPRHVPAPQPWTGKPS
jgi:putative ABC transport system ATP-binding protein